ncbi:MAG: CRTAC1 family protein [Acidobacteriota bacterium]|nr:CRTAC1 family protein [Acidobacteriota bacterium]MDH3785649.1 CRTAC1 family protein [Acidobacteriota bacterium]
MRPLLIAALIALAADAMAADLRFVDVTAEAGVAVKNVCGESPAKKRWLVEAMGAGAAWLDFDGDGNLDLYVVNGSTFDRPADGGEPNRLFRGDGQGGFSDVTAAAGVGHRGWGFGAAAGDVNGDGLVDLFVTNLGPNVLYLNKGDGTFRDATKASGVSGDQWSSSAALFDMDLDGDLDLYVGNYMVTDPKLVPARGSKNADHCQYKGIAVACGPRGERPIQDQLYRNNGSGVFTDVTARSGVSLETPRYALGVVTFDYDNDGDQDIYVANDSVANSLWRNNGDGTFSDQGLRSMAALNADGRSQAGMGTDAGDFDGDGWMDVVVTNFAHDLNTLYRNKAGKFFVDDSQLAGLGPTFLTLSWGVGLRDFDRDGDLDLMIANGHVYPEVDGYSVGTKFRQRNHLFLQTEGRLKPHNAADGDGFSLERSFRGAAFADYDNDGDIDIFLTTLDEPSVLLRNELDDDSRWFGVRLIGEKSNRSAIGARVRLRVGERSWVQERVGGGSYLCGSDPRILIGLGDLKQPVSAEIQWPGGGRETIADVPLGRWLTWREGENSR